MTNLTALVEGFSDPVLVLAPDMKVHLYNSAALDIFEQLEADTFLFLVTRDADLLEAVKATFDKQQKNNLTFTLKKRYKRTINATLIPLESEATDEADRFESDPGLLFVHMRDMSEPERLAKMRMHFIANASHELRTPLASLTGFVETLQTTARKDEKSRDRFLLVMAEQTRRMTRLIADLLSLSQLEMNTDAPPDIAVNVIELVSGIIDLLSPLAQKHNVTFKIDVPDEPLFTCGDRDELVQVFQNIVQNAIRYGGEGGKVWISISQISGSKNHGPRLSISFRDNGRGIEAKHIPRLTQRFYRVDKVISRNKGGTGLGLAIAKHIIMRHRGKLKSNPNLTRAQHSPSCCRNAKKRVNKIN